MNDGTLRLATRSSPLAREQTGLVKRALLAAGAVGEVEEVIVDTRGDRRLDVAIAELNEHGVFTTEVDAVVLSGDADVAVHSAKDLPSSVEAPGLTIAAVLARGEVRDALVGRTLDELGPGAPIATGSPRRRVQLAALRPDLTFAPLRGNIGRRLEKVPNGGAIVVALVALERLGLTARAAEVLPVSVLLPQVGQGAIALRCRSDDDLVLRALAAIDDALVHRAVAAERAFLARLGGGCDAPVGAYATTQTTDGPIEIEAMIASADGHVVLKRHHVANDPFAAGRGLAELLLFADGGHALVDADR
jgi:hydroxymethylbilane synthase